MKKEPYSLRFYPGEIVDLDACKEALGLDSREHTLAVAIHLLRRTIERSDALQLANTDRVRLAQGVER